MIEAAGSVTSPAIELLTDASAADCVWVYVETPTGATSADLDPLLTRYGLRSSAVADCLERSTLPRIGGDDRLVAATFLLPTAARPLDARPPVFGLFVGTDFVLTIHDGGARQVAELFRECQADLLARRMALQDGRSGLAAFVVERAVVQATRAAAGIANRAREMASGEALPGRDASARAIVALRAEATNLAAVTAAEGQVVGGLADRLGRDGDPDSRIAASWGALVGRLGEATSVARSAAESLDATLAARGLIAAEGTLRIVGFGVAVATLTLPPILALALFALSGAAALPQAFEVALGGVAAYVVGGLYAFRRNGWL